MPPVEGCNKVFLGGLDYSGVLMDGRKAPSRYLRRIFFGIEEDVERQKP